MINIQKDQIEILKKYLPDVQQWIDNDDLYTLLDNFDDLITAIGFDENWELTEEGLMLQLLYDRIYMQNK